MTNKKALPDDITQFFKGESVFFQNKKTEELPLPVTEESAKKQKKNTPPTAHAATVSSNHATKPPLTHNTTTPNNPDSVTPSNHDQMTPSEIEQIRKTVKQFGKEAATHRFTEDEKRKIAEIVYTYERQGFRTSENEITRIAVNWLLQDYQRYGAQSVLARLLESLHT